MPRTRRLWEPGDLLSIVGRAHEGRPVFVTDDDRRFFVDRLRRVFVVPRVDLVAWGLLINHYHLVIRVRDEVPGTLFLEFNTALAQRERRRRGDHGAVFQNRFWSRQCTGSGEVLGLLTYVLGNPVHHGVVPSAEALESYAWTAYPEVLGLAAPGLVNPGMTLALIHPDPTIARALLREAMVERVARWHAERAGIDVCDEPGCLGPADACLLVHVSRRCERNPAPAPPPPPQTPLDGISLAHDQRRGRRTRLLVAGWSPIHLVASVAPRVAADPDAVLRGVRTHAESRARAIVAHVACDGAGLSVAEVAAVLGVSGSALPAARRRGRALLLARGWSIDDVLSWPVP